MVSSFEILLTILIIYFAARVTRMEERVNQLEANDTSFTGTVTDIAKGIKQSVDEVRR